MRDLLAGRRGMNVLRRRARAWVPYEMRLRIALARRGWRDHRARVAFVARAHGAIRPPFEHSSYELPFVDYPGQEQFARAKSQNQRLLGDAVDGTVVGPGETFSLWRLAGRPDARAGYAPGAALRGGTLTAEPGGSTCLLSTVVYNAALLAGIEIVERYEHSVDVYGEERYFELGRDCTIEYGYRDLRFSNPFPYAVVLSVDIEADRVRAAVGADRPPDLTVDVVVDELVREPALTRVVVDPGLKPGEERIVEPGHDGLVVRTVRTITWDGTLRRESRSESRHESRPRVIARGA